MDKDNPNGKSEGLSDKDILQRSKYFVATANYLVNIETGKKRPYCNWGRHIGKVLWKLQERIFSDLENKRKTVCFQLFGFNSEGEEVGEFSWEFVDKTLRKSGWRSVVYQPKTCWQKVSDMK